jgi:tRNA U55 pseudouridine synthase TruB
LRREQVGEFGLDLSVPLNSLTSENIQTYLQRPELAVSHLPRLEVTLDEEIDLLHGKLISQQSKTEDGTLMQTFNPSGRFIGLVTAQGNYWKAKKMFQ